MAEIIQAVRNGANPNSKLPAPLALMDIGADWASMLRRIGEFLPTGQTSVPFTNPPGSIPLGYTNTTDGWLEARKGFLSELVPELTSAFAVGLSHLGSQPWSILFTSKQNSTQELDGAPGIPLTGGVGSGWQSGWPISDEPIPNVYEIEVKIKRYGWASGAKVSTVTFGLAIICIYVGVLGLYTVYTLWHLLGKNSGFVQSFGGVRDILTLALKSEEPKELDNCGAGVRHRNTWRHMVKIRAGPETRKLELVFAGRTGLASVQKDEEYV